MNSLSDIEISTLLRKYGVQPKKKRGQSFLKDQNIAQEIVRAAEITTDDTVLEIGGGLGVLTKWLAEEAGHVYVIEIEACLVDALTDLFRETKNVTIIKGDALTIGLPQVTKVVSNLPYSISSEITFRLLRDVNFDWAILMYQKEFANRLGARPGSEDYSRLTINFQYLAEAEPIMEIPSRMFYPQPVVDSIVVRIRRRPHDPQARDIEIFQWMINGIYSYPKKSLRNALRIWFKTLGVERNLAEEVIEQSEAGLTGDEHLRGISIESLVVLADTIFEFVRDGKLPKARGS
ncbi:MAG: ribosomal RNA small subunit methyltransferase A [Candidatus Thorarchaeota archaeon]|nr:ribosomal RNA small subunit methyltransferase A [Candidatus Thorarchaeota archaeon]